MSYLLICAISLDSTSLSGFNFNGRGGGFGSGRDTDGKDTEESVLGPGTKDEDGSLEAL